jgi:ubiquinone biosynthesis protein
MRDVDTWAFSDHPPWQLDIERCTWRADADRLRDRSRAMVPELVRPRRLPPLWRFGEASALIGGGLLTWAVSERRRGGAESRSGLSRRLRRAFERLGPAYIKLGQIISSGRGLFPEELVEAFKACRDQVPPEPFAAVRQVVEADLGQPIEALFSRFDEQCLAAASIAQVHAATLRSGEEVVVKVQRPQVEERVRRDIAAMAWIAPHLTGRLPIAALANPPALVELFAETITEELDFRLEAQNMLDIACLLREAGQTIIVLPRPHPTLVTRRVLVMERLSGFKYDDVEGMRAAGIDCSSVLRSMMISFLEGAMIHGVFHGDLHGGNLFVQADGRVALFDYGMTGRMDERQRLAFLRMMMTGAMNDVRGQVEAFRDLGALPADADIDGILRLLKVDQPIQDPTKMEPEMLVREIQAVLRGLLAQGARLPKHLMLYVKNMLFFDGAIAHLAPDLNMFEEVAKTYAYFAANHAERIERDVGIDPSRNALNLDNMRAQLGLEGDVDSITHRELQERRQVIQQSIDAAGGLPRV